MSVMMALGNEVGNSVWEANLRGQTKPNPRSSREDKERWIRAKYEAKEFLTHPQSVIPLNEQVSLLNKASIPLKMLALDGLLQSVHKELYLHCFG